MISDCPAYAPFGVVAGCDLCRRHHVMPDGFCLTVWLDGISATWPPVISLDANEGDWA